MNCCDNTKTISEFLTFSITNLILIILDMAFMKQLMMPLRNNLNCFQVTAATGTPSPPVFSCMYACSTPFSVLTAA